MPAVIVFKLGTTPARWARIIASGGTYGPTSLAVIESNEQCIKVSGWVKMETYYRQERELIIY